MELAIRFAPRLSGQGGSQVTLCALGDLILAGQWDELAQAGGLAAALEELSGASARDDLVFANLETAVLGRDGKIAKRPLVLAKAETVIEALEVLRVNVVNLANNHTFDAFQSGFEQVRRALEGAGVRHLGAGASAKAARRPLVVERRGIRFGWLAYADASTRPSHVAAGTGTYGVNPLDASVALAEVQALRPRVDHVIVSLHWGVEYCDLPSPDQVRLARGLVDRGASLILGHHAHVVQGVEAHAGGVIAYNLGNATTCDFWIGGRLAIRQTARTQSSFLLRAAFSRQRLEEVELVPFRAQRQTVRLGDERARTFLRRANRRLQAGVSVARWRRVRLYEDVVLRTLRKLHPRVVRSVRLGHVAQLFRNFSSSLRGRDPA